MNTREIAEEYRLSHWSGIMQERRASGLSIKAFCKNAGFHENAYYYWQRKLREAAVTELAERNPGKELIPIGWTRVTPTENLPENAISEGSLEIDISGCRVTVNSETSPGLIIKVCRALKAL